MPNWLTESIIHLEQGIPDETLFPSRGAGTYSRAVKDDTLSLFLDLFHHRMISFLYRAWASANKAVDFDRFLDTEDEGQGKTALEAPRFSIWIGSTFGAGTPALARSQTLPQFSRLAFAGHLSCQTRHAEGLTSILSAYFALPVELLQFVGQWLVLPEENQCRMGDPESGCHIGINSFVGKRVWDHQLKFRLRIGPMNQERVNRFLPGGRDHAHLHAWVNYYTARRWIWDVQFIVERKEVPSTRLGLGGQLGWTTWVKSEDLEHDAEDLILSGDAELPGAA